MKTPRRTTLADIARVADVHVTTVSLAMRNNPRIPEVTKARIRALAEKMGYVPDPMMRALISYRGQNKSRRNPPTLAYITNWKTRWGWKKITAHPDFYDGAESRARELGFTLDHFWLGEPNLTHERLSSIFRNRGITGLIIASHGFALGDALQLDWSRFSAIKIDYYPHQPLLHNVTNNQCDIARLAFQHALEAGYRRIGFVMHRGWDYAVDHYWTAGFLCEQQHVPEDQRIPPYIFPGAQPREGWFNEYGMPGVVDSADFQRWFDKYKPDILLSKASFVMPALKVLKFKIPKDVAFADLFLDDTSGSIAGVRQNHRTVGELAVELLAGQLQHNKYGVPEIPTTTFVEGTWFDGATCPRLSSARV
jgi:LacI family transcriptional regulator